MTITIYDLEILRAIPGRDGSKTEGVDYCEGWNDHANMGVSVLCAYDYGTDRHRVFTAENAADWTDLVHDHSRTFVGFNSMRFDNAVLRATPGWAAPEDAICYDLLREIWSAKGLDPDNFSGRTHGGVGLDAMCALNFGTNKTGNGALAPEMWQRGRYGEVIDYCLNDVRLTKQLMDKVLHHGALDVPKDAGSEWLKIRRP